MVVNKARWFEFHKHTFQRQDSVLKTKFKVYQKIDFSII